MRNSYNVIFAPLSKAPGRWLDHSCGNLPSPEVPVAQGVKFQFFRHSGPACGTASFKFQIGLLMSTVFLMQSMAITPTSAVSTGLSPTNSVWKKSHGHNEQVRAAFGKACEKMLIREVDRADSEILVAIYSITRKSITSALVRAVSRGVKVEVKYDLKSYEWQGMKTAIGYMKKRGVLCTPVKMNGKYAKMHHKFMIIDSKRVLTGSFNYTSSASESNYENLVLIDSATIAKTFTAEFERIRDL